MKLHRKIEGVPEALVPRKPTWSQPHRHVDITLRPALRKRSVQQGQNYFGACLELALQASDDLLTIPFRSSHHPILAPAPTQGA